MIIGDDELKKKVLVLKDMKKGSQEEVLLESLVARLKEKGNLR
jgi:histidyl-tRNA synthetase